MAFLEYKPTGVMFHYCSMNAMLGILKSQSLWFSDLRSSNDPRELTYGIDNVLGAIALAKQLAPNRDLQSQIDKLIPSVVGYLNRASIYCACLSLSRDSLPMWREYGDNCKGFAVGFRATSVVDMPVRVQKVRYLAEDEDNSNFAHLIIDIAEDLLRTKDSIEYAAKNSQLVSAIVPLKHESWSYEREVRLTFAQRHVGPIAGEHPFFQFTSMLPDGKPWKWSQPLKREVAGRSVGYLQFSFGRYKNKIFDASGAIESVTIGPHCELAEEKLSEILKENGYTNFTIDRSHCQIR